MKSLPSLLIAAAFALLTFALWAYLNRPAREPPWPTLIQGCRVLARSAPTRTPPTTVLPTGEEIDSDLKLLEGKVHAVRTYSVQGHAGADARARRAGTT